MIPHIYTLTPGLFNLFSGGDMIRLLRFFLGTLLFFSTASVQLGINFGKGSGIIVESGAEFDVGVGTQIHDGFIETNGVLNISNGITLNNASIVSHQGTIVTNDSFPVVGTNATWLVESAPYYSKITFDGSLSGTTYLSLGEADTLVMDGSSVIPFVLVTPSDSIGTIIRGVAGAVGSNKIKLQSGAIAAVNLTGVLGANIYLSGDADNNDEVGDDTAALHLMNDLVFAPGFGPGVFDVETPGTNRIYFYNHRMLFGGDNANPDPEEDDDGSFIIMGEQTWRDAHAQLTGPVYMDQDAAIIFENTGILNGDGNVLNLGSAVAPLVNSSGTSCQVTLSNIRFDGSASIDWFSAPNDCSWKCVNCVFDTALQSLQVDGVVSQTTNILNGDAVFDHVRLTLHSNVALNGAWKCVYASMLTIDLNGHALDLANGSLETLEIQAEIHIKNGRLINVSGSKFDLFPNSRLRLENVDVYLADDTQFAGAALFVDGHCSLLGVAGSVFSLSAATLEGDPISPYLIINPQSTLTIGDGIIYSHNNTNHDNFVFVNSTSRLELMGGIFRRPNRAEPSVEPLMLTLGTLVIDHTSVIQPGTGGIKIGDGILSDNNLGIEIRPGGTLTIGLDTEAGVSGGSFIYANCE